MGGGFNDKPFELNYKCLIISGAIAGGYYLLPPKNSLVAVSLLFGSYIALAWYDAYEMCDYKLSANTIIHPLTADLKPPVDSQDQYSFEE
jgi:hypothetical protein